MTILAHLSKAYDDRIERLTALLRLRTEWERRTIRNRVQASL